MPDTPGRYEDLGFTTIIFWYIVKALTDIINSVNALLMPYWLTTIIFLVNARKDV